MRILIQTQADAGQDWSRVMEMRGPRRSVHPALSGWHVAAYRYCGTAELLNGRLFISSRCVVRPSFRVSERTRWD